MAARIGFVTSPNGRLLGKLVVIVAVMFGFGYALVPMYRAICDALGINVLTLAEQRATGKTDAAAVNTQVDKTRTITIELDANARGPWEFKPAVRSLQVHPGELHTVVYEFRNVQSRAMVAQAIPSYAPANAAPHFVKLECFCFTEHTLAAGESRRWPVAFVIDPKLPRDVTTITLSYTFFEVAGKSPAARRDAAAAKGDAAAAKGDAG